MSTYLAKEWQIRALLRGTMTRVVSKKPIDPRGGELLFKDPRRALARVLGATVEWAWIVNLANP